MADTPCPGYRPDHNGECLNCDEPADAHLDPASAARAALIATLAAHLRAAWRHSCTSWPVAPVYICQHCRADLPSLTSPHKSICPIAEAEALLSAVPVSEIRQKDDVCDPNTISDSKLTMAAPVHDSAISGVGSAGGISPSSTTTAAATVGGVEHTSEAAPDAPAGDAAPAVCEHGGLRRQCETCALLARVQELEVEHTTHDGEAIVHVRYGHLAGLEAKVQELEAWIEHINEERTHEENVARAQSKRADAAEASRDSYRAVLDKICTLIDPHIGTAGVPENIFETVTRLVHALNTCEIHADVEGIAERTACAVCLTEALAKVQELEAETALYDRMRQGYMDFRNAEAEVLKAKVQELERALAGSGEIAENRYGSAKAEILRLEGEIEIARSQRAELERERDQAKRGSDSANGTIRKLAAQTKQALERIEELEAEVAKEKERTSLQYGRWEAQGKRADELEREVARLKEKLPKGPGWYKHPDGFGT